MSKHAPGDAGPPTRPGADALTREIERNLLTLEQWKRRNQGPARPYSFSLEREGRKLVYCGLPHISDPGDAALGGLERRWEEFVRETHGKPRTALVEGRCRVPRATREEAITRSGGEGGLLTFLAARDQVNTASPEPSLSELVTALSRSFDPATIAHAYQLRSLLVAIANGEEVDDAALPRPPEQLPGIDFAVGRSSFERRHAQIIGARAGERIRDMTYLRRLTDPAGVGPINAVMEADARYRDVAIVMAIRRRWVAGENLFVVFGVAHAHIQEPALRAVLQSRPAAEQGVDHL